MQVGTAKATGRKSQAVSRGMVAPPQTRGGQKPIGADARVRVLARALHEINLKAGRILRPEDALRCAENILLQERTDDE